MQPTQNQTTQSVSEAFLKEQSRLLGHAASDNDMQQVQAILEAHPEVVHFRSGLLQSTPMHFASDRGFVDIVQCLLEAGADVNASEGASGTTPLHWAAAGGRIEVVKLLVSHKADIEATDAWHNLSPLGWAAVVADTPQAEIIHYLLDQGARMDLFTVVALCRSEDVRALATSHPALLHQRMNLLDDARSPLHLATLRNLPDMVELLIACGAEVNGKTSWGQTAFCLACRAHNTVVMDALGRLGAATDLSTLVATDQLVEAEVLLRSHSDLLNPTGEYAQLLHLTARENFYEAAELLLNYEADPNALAGMIVDELLCQVTPLHRAALHGQTEIARVLLKRGADPNRPTVGYWDVTALHLAAWRGHVEAARVLVEYGADPNRKDRHGLDTPLEWATTGDKEAILALLKPLTNDT